MRCVGAVVFHLGMTIVLDRPRVGELDVAVGALREWQQDRAPLQLHPGDLGWFCRFGVEATAAAVRTWSRDGRIVAVGLLDEPNLLRLTVAPDLQGDEGTARHLIEDLVDPERGVLPEGKAYLELPNGMLVKELLLERGWEPDEQFTPLSRDLAEPVGDPGLLWIEVIGTERAQVWGTVVRAAFDKSTFTVERWHAMAAGSPFADARFLVGYDDQETAVVAVGVWSAGPGRPGLLEPMGVHRDHRGHGYGRAITVAAAAALRDMGASSALVCTPSSYVGAVATYRSAGFQLLPERRDLCRNA
jgi:ribosomal protein S18 acetylase RimI-like enzyme